jgi:tetratricopeptide (TPR) repeat protein
MYFRLRSRLQPEVSGKSRLDGTPNTTTQELPDFFISRAGADALFAETIGRIVEDAGHRVVLQQWDFAPHNFMERMHAALSSGARIIALLSNEYLASKHCESEWLNGIATDPLNTNARLIVLRVNECTPRGLLTALAYWDLVPIRDQPEQVRDVVLTAIKPGRHKGDGLACEQYWRAARTVLHPEIKPTPSFTGRAQELLKIGNALRPGDAAAITQSAAIFGLGGIGKSTLAREYAYQARDGYAGVWWLNAARAKDGKSWERLEKGLVDLGAIFFRGLNQVEDRAAAARRTLEFIANDGFAKPWLLVYDNVDDAAVLRQWAPVGNAHILVTSRLGAWGAGVAKVEVEEWPMPEAVSYLFKESGRSDLTTANVEAIATALGRLPLALSHAAAYLRENENATAESYLAAIAKHMREAPESAEYGRAVFATFQEQVEQVEARAPGARAILSLAAFYGPDDIPEELFTQAAEHYPAALAQVATSPVKLEKAIGALNRFSLVDFVPDTRTFSVHRLVQAAARDALAGEASQWLQSALLAASAAFPEPTFDTWPTCERLVSHVRAVTSQVTADSVRLGWLLTAAGTYLQERAALADVLPLYERSLAIRDRLAKADPENAGWQRELSVSHSKIGDVLVDQGNLPAALDSYQASHAIFDRLAKADPGNAGWQRDLSVSQGNIGDVLRAQRNLPAALDSYQASHAIFDRLAKADPGNAGWQRDLSVSQGKIGDVLVDQRNLPAALDSYQASHAIFDRLAKADPGNADWQRDLSVSQGKIGDVLLDQGNLPAALDSYQASLAIRDRLAKADPGNAGWQRDLSVSQDNIGDVLRAQGNLPAALDSYQASHAIFDRLAKADPGNAGWQRDLAISHGCVGTIEALQGARDRALKALREGRDIIARLKAQAPDNVMLPKDLAWFDGQIAALEG